MSVISLMTDFGLEDAYVGMMKAVMLRIAPDISLVDLCHSIPPQDVIEAAWLLGSSYAYFPKDTVHLAVVDPGVGTSRRAIALHAGDHYFVGPDNGIFSQILEKESDFHAVELTNSSYFLPEISYTFQGRDLFSPVAAHLASGVPLDEFGPEIHDPIRITLPQPEKIPGGLRLHIVRIDRYGNLITDLSEQQFQEWIADYQGKLVLDIGRRRIEEIHHVYSDVPTGGVVALFGSSGRLEIAVNGDSAQEILRAGKDTPVMLSTITDIWGI